MDEDAHWPLPGKEGDIAPLVRGWDDGDLALVLPLLLRTERVGIDFRWRNKLEFRALARLHFRKLPRKGFRWMRHIRPYRIFTLIDASPQDRVVNVAMPSRRGLGGTSLLETMLIIASARIVEARRIFEIGTFLGSNTFNMALNLPEDAKISRWTWTSGPWPTSNSTPKTRLSHSCTLRRNRPSILPARQLPIRSPRSLAIPRRLTSRHGRDR